MLAAEFRCDFLCALIAKAIEDDEALLAEVDIQDDELSLLLGAWWLVITVLRLALLVVICHICLSLETLCEADVALLHFFVVVLWLGEHLRLLCGVKLSAKGLGLGNELAADWLCWGLCGRLGRLRDEWVWIVVGWSWISLLGSCLFTGSLALGLRLDRLNLVRNLILS